MPSVTWIVICFWPNIGIPVKTLTIVVQSLFLANLVKVSLFSQPGEPVLTYADHVAPIIQENCVVCHNPQGIGPFSLTTYEQVKRRARQIVEVTQSHYMPPWKPEAGFGPPLIGARHLEK